MKKLLLILLNVLLCHLYTWSQSGSGNAVSFDGIDDEINFPQQTVVYDNFTMEAWVYPKGSTDLYVETTYGLLGSVGRHQYLIFPTHGEQFENVDVIAGAGIEVGVNGIAVYEHSGFYMPSLLVWNGTIAGWTHIAVVYTNRQPSLYVNGSLVKTGLQSTRSRVYASNQSIGGGYWGHFQGDADEIRIWNRSLTQSEISNRINKRITSSDPLFPNLANYYNLDETYGETVFDKGFFAKNGMLKNGAARIKSGAIIMDAGSYCTANGLSGANGYIQNVSVHNGFNKSSNWDGYSDFTSCSVTAAPGEKLRFSITPAYLNNKHLLYPKMWIDWNEDGDFSDRGETVFAPSVAIRHKTKFWVDIPSCVSPGNKRIRIALLADKCADGCGTYQYGEVEDYTLKMVAAKPYVTEAYKNVFTTDTVYDEGKIYPNPASNYIKVDRSGDSKSALQAYPAQLIIVDVNGKLIKRFNVYKAVELIDVSSIPNGVYFIKITGSTTVTCSKIVISH